MKTRIVIVLSAAVLLLSSCFSPLQQSGTGSISVTVPPLSETELSGSALSASQTGGDPYYAAVFVYKDGSEAGFDETRVSSSEPAELTVDGIPEGDGYSLVVTIGQKERGAIFPETYGSNAEESFSVTGGRLTPVSVEMQASPFFYALEGRRLKGLALSGETIMTATEDSVYALQGSLADRSLSEAGSTSTGWTINSIDQGVEPEGANAGANLAWASGPGTRIVPFSLDGGSVVAGRNIAGGYTETRNILSSRGYYADVTDGDGVAVAAFQIDGGMGGGQAYSSDWGDSGDDLKDFVSGQPVLSVDVWEGTETKRAFLSTKIGTFAVTDGIFEGADQDELTEAFLSGDPVFNDSGDATLIPISLSIDGQNRRINALTATANRDGTGGWVYLATSRGLYRATADDVETTDADDNAALTAGVGETALVPGTGGLQVFDLAATEDYVVAMGRSRLVIASIEDNSSVTIPNVAGVPGVPELGRSESGIKGVRFLEDENGDLYLAMAGDFGFAALNVDTLF